MVSDIVMKKLVVLSMLVIGVKCIFPANLHEILFNVSWNFDGYRNPFVNPPTVTAEADHRYDFIVIGSGSSGSVIANRLSENPKWNVLLLEAGVEPTPLTDIPVLMNYFQFTDYNWGYLMEEEPNMCLGLTDRRMAWPRGKVLGGTSIINFMIHIRGNPRDYDRWAAMGNKGWSYADLLPYFKKSEDFRAGYGDEGYHSTGGYLGVQDVDAKSGSVHAFVRAMEEFGYKYVDYNGEEQMGISYVQATMKDGRRSSAYTAFLRPVIKRDNLKIYTGARVVKILIDESTRRAYGVKFVKDKKTYIVKASKEVVLSAGAFNSPQLLMLSGIGPRNHLGDLGIPLIKDLAVGKKLYDHLTFLGLIFTVNSTITLRFEDLFEASTMLEYLLAKRGLFASLSGVEALGIVQTRVSKDPDPKYPDMEFIFVGGGLHTDRGDLYRKTFRIPDSTYDTVWKPLEDRQAFSILPMLYHPKSYGNLTLKSKNPYHAPRLHGNYLSDRDNSDVRSFIAAIRLTQEIIDMPSLRKYDARIWDVKIPGCEGHDFNSDGYWECALRHVSVTLHHQVATCKMGPPTDPEAVVSEELKVYGIEGLRVADTSIIPQAPSAHTNVPAFMIGEKAADMIKRAWLGT